MLKLIRRLLGDERVRFLLVGGINTVVGYLLFAVFQLTLGHIIGYLGSLYLSYAIATLVAFYLHRRFTFRAAKTGQLGIDFLRFQSVYVVSLAVNTILLPVLVEWGGWRPLVAQLVIVVVTTIISYVGHKWFSFRRPSVGKPVDRPDET
ncbi:MAG: polysaccharide biosynthesis protein GtrA [Microbacteriaceae bacterium]|nr:polysaccharide biosynthesis protein GtrA [Microbacteriaceae bacterium]